MTALCQFQAQALHSPRGEGAAGAKTLLVTYNRYYNTPLGIRNLAQLRRRFDCDILIQSVNPISVKKIIRTTLRELGSSFHWPVLAGQTVFPVQIALSHGVPLIVWGAHQGIEQVGMFSHLHEVEMTRRYRKDHDLMGYEADDLLSVFDSLSEADIWQYRYPDEASLQSIGVRGIYLSNYSLGSIGSASRYGEDCWIRARSSHTDF